MRKHKILSMVRLLPVALIALTGCTVTDPSTDLEVRITMPGTGAVIGGQIKDSMGRLISALVTITITGQDASHIVDLMNEQVNTLTTSSGFVVMAVNDTIPLSADDPVKFTVTATATGYIGASKQIIVDQTIGKSFEMQLLSSDLSDLPAGLAGDQQTAGTNGSGALTAPVVVSPPAHPTSGARSSLEIPAGSSFFDSNGNRLTGNLTVTFILGDLRSDTTQLADRFFPGERNNIMGPDSTTIFPVAFIILNVVDASGRVADSSNAAVRLTTVIPEGTINPFAGRAFMQGDTISVSRRDNDGMWNRQVEGILSAPDGNGNFPVVFSFEAGQFGLKRDLGKTLQTIDNADAVYDEYGEEIIGAFGGWNNNHQNYRLSWDGARGHQFRVIIEASEFDPRVNIYDVDFRVKTYADMAFSIADRNFQRHWFRVISDGDTFTYSGGSIADMTRVFNMAWPFPASKTVNFDIYGKMPAGRDPSEIRVSGLAVAIANAADTSVWRSVGSAQRGQISIPDLKVGRSYYLKGTYTFRGQTRTANTPWTRMVTATTDTLQYWYQLSEDEADEYAKGG